MIRNFDKSSKFDPTFQYDPLIIIEVSEKGNVITVQRLRDGKIYKRHPNDIKLYHSQPPHQPITHGNMSFHSTVQPYWHAYLNEDDGSGIEFDTQVPHHVPGEELVERGFIGEVPDVPDIPIRQRPVRIRNPNPRYYNENVVNY